MTHRGVETERNTDSFSEAEGEQAEHKRNGKSLPDDIIDAVIAVFKRGTEVAVQQIAQIAKVLFPERLVQMVFRFDVTLDFRRSRRPFFVKGSAGGDMHQQEGEQTDNNQQRDHANQTPDEIHSRMQRDTSAVFEARQAIASGETATERYARKE